MEETYIVETHNLTKTYSGRNVVNNVNMHIKKGSIYGFVGENGSGKTTIMRLIMGLSIPSKGDYSLFGVDWKKSEIYKIRKNISAIVETPSLVVSMNAYDNLKYACYYCGIKDLSIIEPTLKKVGLDNVPKNKKVKNFSLGMRQRLGIAVLLLSSPKLLLLDEPMNGLDPEGIKEVRDIIYDLNKQGITILISSHILSELEKVATDWGFISHGNLLEEISSQELNDKCAKSIEVGYRDGNKLEEAIKKIGISNYKNSSNSSFRIFDDIKPLDLLNKLKNEGVEIEDINTSHGSVEEYYFDLVRNGGNNNE